MTIVGLDFCSPSDAAERVALYHRASPSTISCPIPGLIRVFSWDIPTPRVFSLYIPTRAQGIYEDNTHGVGISQDNTHIKPIIGHSIITGTHMYIFVRLYTKITPIALDIYEDNTHIKPSIGHSINTGTHMCIFVLIVGLSTTSMVACVRETG